MLFLCWDHSRCTFCECFLFSGNATSDKVNKILILILENESVEAGDRPKPVIIDKDFNEIFLSFCILIISMERIEWLAAGFFSLLLQVDLRVKIIHLYQPGESLSVMRFASGYNHKPGHLHNRPLLRTWLHNYWAFNFRCVVLVRFQSRWAEDMVDPMNH